MKKKLPLKKTQFGVCFMMNKIYVVGGRTQNSEFSNSCEVYDVEENLWSRIACLNEGVCRPSICSLNNQAILKFGGLNKFGFIEKGIERYNPKLNVWDLVAYSFKPGSQEMEILFKCMSLQINDTQVLVIGGRNYQSFKTDTAFVYEEQKEDQRKFALKYNAKVQQFDKRDLLSFAGYFSDANPIPHNGSLYFLRYDYTHDEEFQFK